MYYFCIIYTKVWTCIIFTKFMHNFFKHKNLDMDNLCIIYAYNFLNHKAGKFANITVIQLYSILCILIYALFKHNLLHYLCITILEDLKFSSKKS